MASFFDTEQNRAESSFFFLLASSWLVMRRILSSSFQAPTIEAFHASTAGTRSEYGTPMNFMERRNARGGALKRLQYEQRLDAKTWNRKDPTRGALTEEIQRITERKHLAQTGTRSAHFALNRIPL